jgi:hypothetical protein
VAAGAAVDAGRARGERVGTCCACISRSTGTTRAAVTLCTTGTADATSAARCARAVDQGGRAVAAGTAGPAVAAGTAGHLAVGARASCVAPHPGHELLARGTACTDNRPGLAAGTASTTIATTEGTVTTDTARAPVTGSARVSAGSAVTGRTEVPAHSTGAAAATAAAVATEAAGPTIAAQVIQADAPRAARSASTTRAAGAAGPADASKAQHESGSAAGAAVAA